MQCLAHAHVVFRDAVGRIHNRRGHRAARSQHDRVTQAATAQHCRYSCIGQVGHSDDRSLGGACERGRNGLNRCGQGRQAIAAGIGLCQLRHRLNNRIHLLLCGKQQLTRSNLFSRATAHRLNWIEGCQVNGVFNSQRGFQLRLSDVPQRQQCGQGRYHAITGRRQELANPLARHGIDAAEHHNATNGRLRRQLKADIALGISSTGHVACYVNAGARGVVINRRVLHIAINRLGGIGLGDAVNLKRQLLGNEVASRLDVESKYSFNKLTGLQEAKVSTVVVDGAARCGGKQRLEVGHAKRWIHKVAVSVLDLHTHHAETTCHQGHL